jgi:hypothetical protein
MAPLIGDAVMRRDEADEVVPLAKLEDIVGAVGSIASSLP